VRGIHAGGLFGFLATIICAVGVFLYLIFGKDESRARDCLLLAWLGKQLSWCQEAV